MQRINGQKCLKELAALNKELSKVKEESDLAVESSSPDKKDFPWNITNQVEDKVKLILQTNVSDVASSQKYLLAEVLNVIRIKHKVGVNPEYS
jgi:hypothetical protein